MSDDDVLVRLTQDQALVLFELLATATEDGTVKPRHTAEQNVLWAVEGQLEKALIQPLKPDYRELLESARARLGDSHE